MKRFTSSLRNVKVASPCSADWDRMIGDERARFCGQCELNVYNLSAMSTLEAESHVFLDSTGRLGMHTMGTIAAPTAHEPRVVVGQLVAPVRVCPVTAKRKPRA